MQLGSTSLVLRVPYSSANQVAWLEGFIEMAALLLFESTVDVSRVDAAVVSNGNGLSAGGSTFGDDDAAAEIRVSYPPMSSLTLHGGKHLRTRHSDTRNLVTPDPAVFYDSFPFRKCKLLL